MDAEAENIKMEMQAAFKKSIAHISKLKVDKPENQP
jgi:hypothetical protein